MTAAPRLILASGSVVRAKMLGDAGLTFETDPARIDEASVKASLGREKAGGGEIADTLAELKAVTVSRRHPGAFVLGADQVLEFEGRLFDKPADVAGARGQVGHRGPGPLGIEVDDVDVGALGREPPGGGGADAPGAARDDRHLPLEEHARTVALDSRAAAVVVFLLFQLVSDYF